MSVLDISLEPDHPDQFACNTTMIESNDLIMYADIIDELGKRINDLTTKNDRTKNQAVNSLSRLEQKRKPIESTARRSRSLVRTENVVRMSRSSDANDRMITSNLHRLDQQQQLAHHEFQQQFDQIFSYFDKDVDVDKLAEANGTKMQNMVKSGVETSKVPESKEQAVDTKRYSCKITDVVYKQSPSKNTSRRFSSCNRLMNLVNMFESLTAPKKNNIPNKMNLHSTNEIIMPEKKSVRKIKESVCVEAMKKSQINYNMTTKLISKYTPDAIHKEKCDEYLKPRNVKDIINLFNQRSLGNGNPPAKHVKPSSPSTGKFATSRHNLDKFFKGKFEQSSERAPLKNSVPTPKVNRFNSLNGSVFPSKIPQRNEAFQTDLKQKVSHIENATIFASTPSPPKHKPNFIQMMVNQKQQQQTQNHPLKPGRDSFVFSAEQIKCSKCVNSERPSLKGKNLMNFEGYNEGMQQKPLLNQVQNFQPTKLPLPKQTNNYRKCPNSGSICSDPQSLLSGDYGVVKKKNNIGQHSPTLLTIAETSDKVDSKIPLPHKSYSYPLKHNQRAIVDNTFDLPPQIIQPRSRSQTADIVPYVGSIGTFSHIERKPSPKFDTSKRDPKPKNPIASPSFAQIKHDTSFSSISTLGDILATPLSTTATTINNPLDVELDYENFERYLPRAPIYSQQHSSVETETKSKYISNKRRTSLPENPMISEMRKIEKAAQDKFMQFKKQLNAPITAHNNSESAPIANTTRPVNEHPIVPELRRIENSAHDTFTKYNKLRALQSFVLTQEFIERCHDACTQMSVSVLDGLEYDMKMQQECLYQYIDGLAQNTLNEHFLKQ